MAETFAIMPRLTTLERRILHAVGFVAACRIQDERMDLIIDRLRRDLAVVDKAKGPGVTPEAQDLIDAGRSICAAFRRRTSAGGAVEWMSAHLDASRISQRFHWAALCSLDGV